jgi:hypothetical protein
MFDFLDRKKAAAKGAVDQLSNTAVLGAEPADLAADLAQDLALAPLEPKYEAMFSDEPVEVDIPMHYVVPGNKGNFRGTKVVVHIPFIGDTELFRVAPTTGNLNPPKAEVRGSEILIEWQGPADEPHVVKARIDGVVAQLKDYARWSGADVEAYNRGLVGQLEGMIRARRTHLEKNQALIEVLNIPIGRRESAAGDLVPVRRRRPIKIEAPGVRQAREARISDEDYAALVDQLASARGLIEGLPETFSPMSEEGFRDLLLVILNNQFGPSGGEMFRRKGKTDIVVQQERGPVFIAECKIWSGAKAFIEAIEQLLGYLIWRDTKAALVVFVREKDVTGITEKAISQFRSHSLHVNHGAAIGDVPTFHLHHEGDARRLIRVALLIVPIPLME